MGEFHGFGIKKSYFVLLDKILDNIRVLDDTFYCCSDWCKYGEPSPGWVDTSAVFGVSFPMAISNMLLTLSKYHVIS